MKSIIFIGLCLLLSSCVSEKKAMNAWVGRSKHEVILSWGPPERTASDGNHGEILIYSFQTYNPYTRQVFYKCRILYINKQDDVYSWLIKNSIVPPQQMDISLYVR